MNNNNQKPDITIPSMEELLHIPEIPLTEQNREIIVARTMEKIKFIQNSKQSNISPNSASPYKKVKKPLLIAAIIALSSTLLATTNYINITEVFRDIFQKGYNNIGSSGMLLGKKDYHNGVMLNATGVVADKNTMTVSFDITYKKGMYFTGEYISFDDFELSIEDEANTLIKNIFTDEVIQPTGGIIGWSQLDSVHSDDNNISTKRFQVQIDSIDEIQDKNILLKLTNIYEFNKENIASDQDIGQSFSAFVEKTNPVLKPNDDLRLNQKNVVLEQDIPENILVSANLNHMVFSGIPTFVIDNIGVFNNELHVKCKGSTPQFMLSDKSGNLIQPSYIKKHSSNGYDDEYYVFKIQDINELKQMKFSTLLHREVNRIDGIWNINFNLDTDNPELIIQPNQQVSLPNGTLLNVRELMLSNLSMTVTYQIEEGERITSPGITIVFKNNNSNISLQHARVSIKGENIRQHVYRLDQPIDLAQVEAIIIGDIAIPISPK